MTTLNDLSILSDFVYGDSTEQMPVHWVFKLDSGETDSGFRGLAFYDPTTGDVAIGNRGTRATSLQDILISDISIALGMLNFAELDAAQFAKDVLNQLATENLPVRMLYVTGHSLGGAEAAYTAIDLTHLGIAVKAVTFNAPGIPKSATKKGVQYDIVDISTRTDWINKFGGSAPRHKRYIPAERIDWGPFSDPGVLKKIFSPVATFIDGFKGHGMDGIRAFFRNHRDLAMFDAAQASVMPQKYINDIVARDKKLAKELVKAAKADMKDSPELNNNKDAHAEQTTPVSTTMVG